MKLFKALEIVVGEDEVNYRELLAAPTTRETAVVHGIFPKIVTNSIGNCFRDLRDPHKNKLKNKRKRKKRRERRKKSLRLRNASERKRQIRCCNHRSKNRRNY